MFGKNLYCDKTLNIYDVLDDNNNIVDESDVSNELSELNDFFSDHLYVVNMINGQEVYGDSISFVRCKALTNCGGAVMLLDKGMAHCYCIPNDFLFLLLLLNKL